MKTQENASRHVESNEQKGGVLTYPVPTPLVDVSGNAKHDRYILIRLYSNTCRPIQVGFSLV